MENGNFKVGDTVKILEAQMGARGADGRIGVIIEKPKTDINHSGLRFGANGTWIKLKVSKHGNYIWNIGTDIKLELVESAKPTNKFKVGDKVVGNVGASSEYGITIKGWKGEVVEIGKNDTMYVLGKELRYKTLVKQKCFDLVSTATPSIHIYPNSSNPTETIAILKEGNKVVKTAKAICNPMDTYDFKIGADWAVKRLLNIEEKQTFGSQQLKVGDNIEFSYQRYTGENVKRKGTVFEINNGKAMIEHDGIWVPESEVEQTRFPLKNIKFTILPTTYKEVKRQAKVGEYIKALENDSNFSRFKKDEVLKVDSLPLSGVWNGRGVVYTTSKGETNCVIKHNQYVVLENYNPTIQSICENAQNIVLSTATNEQLIAELTKRIGD